MANTYCHKCKELKDSMDFGFNICNDCYSTHVEMCESGSLFQKVIAGVPIDKKLKVTEEWLSNVTKENDKLKAAMDKICFAHSIDEARDIIYDILGEL